MMMRMEDSQESPSSDSLPKSEAEYECTAIPIPNPFRMDARFLFGLEDLAIRLWILYYWILAASIGAFV